MSKPLDIALLIGVERYESHREWDLDGAKSNVLAVADWFEGACKFISSPSKTVICLSDGQDRGLTASLDDIEKAMKQVSVDLCPRSGGRFLFYFCGHGIAVPDPRGEWKDVLLPADAKPKRGGFYVESVLRYFRRFDFEEQLFVIDACREPSPDPLHNVQQLSVDSELAVREPRNPQLVVWKATAQKKLAYGHQDDIEPKGVFTRAFLETLRQEVDAAQAAYIEHQALCVRHDRLKFVLDVELAGRELDQSPGHGSSSGESFVMPMCLARWPLTGGGQDPVSCFPPGYFANVIRRMFRDLEFRPQVDGIRSLLDQHSCASVLLTGACLVQLRWLVDRILAPVGNDSRVTCVDLAANGQAPAVVTVAEALVGDHREWGDETEEQKLSEAVDAFLFEQAEKPVVAVIGLNPANAAAAMVSVVERFSKAVHAAFEASPAERRPSEALILLASEEAVPGFEPSLQAHGIPGAELPALRPFDRREVEGWMLRRRHELPLPISREREAILDDLPFDEGYAEVLEELCAKIEDATGDASPGCTPW